MRKFSKYEKEQIRQIIVESEIRRLSLQETALLVREKLGKDLSVSYVADLKRKARENGRQYISLLAKNRDTYVTEYLTLIEGAKFSEGELYKLALDPNTTIQEKIAVHRELGKYKVIIAQLMDAIPIVSGLQKADIFENMDDQDSRKESDDIVNSEALL